MRAWADVAVLAKPKNLQGGFVARAAAGLPFLLEKGVEVAFVPPVIDAPRRGRVLEAVEQVDGSFLVTFDSVADIDTAEALAGCHCLMRRSDIPDDVWPVDDELIGWVVVDVEGNELGSIGEIVDNPAQTLISIDRADASSAHPLLVPAVDEFIVDFDEEAQRVIVDLPAGLLDL